MLHRLKYFIIFIIFVFPCIYGTRKYNIEQECLNIYGEDLKSVLLGFRRSSDYLIILKREMLDFENHLTNIVLALTTKNLGEITTKVGEMFNITQEAAAINFKCGSTDMENKAMLRFLRNKHYGSNMVTGLPYQNWRVSEVQPGESTTEESPAQRLDRHARRLTADLTHDEQTHFRNMGFEYAGKLIHELIKAVSDGETEREVRSTLLPFGGQEWSTKETTTTTHREHTIITSTMPPILNNDEYTSTKHKAPADHLRLNKKHKPL